MMRTVGVVVACAAVAAACGSKSSESQPEQGKGAEQKPPAPPAPVEAPPRVELLAEQPVRELVERWLGAQNAGDFAAYEPLYAQRFTGVKRIGPRTYTFDRAGWVKDRGRMFGKKMTVSADDVAVSVGARSAVVRFTQTWASGKYKDVGPKQLVVVREGDELRISREEMLQSTIVGDGGAAAPIDRTKLMFAFGNEYVIIETEADRAWATGDPWLIARGSPAIALAAVDLAALPEPVRAWQGRAVTRFPAEGGPCQGAIAELALMTGFEPHFGTVRAWEGDPNMGSGERSSDAEIAREVWSMAGDSVALVGRVSGGCDDALWARVDDKNLVPRLVVQQDDVAAISDAALARFRSLKGYAAIQKAFATETGDKGQWDGYDGAAPRVRVFYDRKVQRHFVAVAAEAGPGCGGFYGELWALFQVVPRGGKQDLVLLTDENNPGEQFFPEAVIDADADGDVEFVSHGMLVRLVGTTYRLVDTWRFPDYDCPC